MRRLLVMLFLAATACSSYDAGPTSPPPPKPAVLLKEVNIPNLPAPFYHFEYNAAGQVTVASYASDLRRYDVSYAGGRLNAMKNNIVLNGDRLDYAYDNAARVSEVRYLDASGVVFTKVHFDYDGQRLIGLQRQRILNQVVMPDKTMSFSYDAQGNVSEVTEHFLMIAGVQDEATVIDRYEQYDTSINVDGFSLIHTEFFDHLILLPTVQLQIGNPARVTHTGDGLNYRVDYTYTYDGQNRPLTKHGEGTITNGTDTGKAFQTNSFFSYY
jgi:hypothetical protein